MGTSILTIVSGYWIIKNKHGNKFIDQWFKNTLRINCPYVFFGDKETIQIVKTFRNQLPTHYVELPIKDFKTSKYWDTIGTHPIHCPSKELNMIWNEKIYLIQKASQINPFNSNFFAWVDAGISIYRDKSPPTSTFPNINKLNHLPCDKFIFSSSDNPEFNPSAIGKYYHYVSGTSYLIHITMIDKFADMWTEYLDKLLISGSWIYTDQVVLTLIYHDHPEMFHKLSHGYGTIIPYLY